jgi:hypothetical protein
VGYFQNCITAYLLSAPEVKSEKRGPKTQLSAVWDRLKTKPTRRALINAGAWKISSVRETQKSELYVQASSGWECETMKQQKVKGGKRIFACDRETLNFKFTA